jgi:SAM-dependent methyltransferase
MPSATDDLRERRARFKARTEQYLKLGHDRLAAAAFVAQGAGNGPGRALDVGTGKGLLAMALASRGFFVTTVDVDAKEQELAAFLAEDLGLKERIAFHLADACALPFSDGSFDVVASMDALHHLEDGERALREAARVLKPGGLLVLADFTEEGFALVERVHAAEGNRHPRTSITPDWASGFLAAGGFRLETREEAHLQDLRRFRRPSGKDTEAIPRGLAGTPFGNMGPRELGRSLEAFAKNWLAHDGCWFLAAEERYGLEAAIELDAASWRRFAAVEASRIRETFGLVSPCGLAGLERALSLRMYGLLNRQHSEWLEGGRTLRFVMDACRVQEARCRKGLPPFPCRPVGMVEFATFAKTLDPAVEVRCLRCPPDPNEGDACTWEFSVVSGSSAGGDDKGKAR